MKKRLISEWKGTIEEEDGVTVVKNPKEPYSVRLIETDVKDLRKRMRKYLYNPIKV